VTSAGVYTRLHDFAAADGFEPRAGMIFGPDGNLYGTTFTAGPTYGTVYKMTTAGALTVLHTFTHGADGGNPRGTLTIGPDGAFYGTASNGGAFGMGTIFKITSDGTFTLLYSFKGISDGAHPYGKLTFGSDGNLYGTTYQSIATGPTPDEAAGD